MSKLRMPYQCLKKCGNNILIAARGSSIDAFDLEGRSLLSTWKCPSILQTESANPPPQISLRLTSQDSESSIDIKLDSASPSVKRRKLSTGEERQNPKENAGKRKTNNRSDAVANGLQSPAVIALAVTKGGQHVIAVTCEDKSIRVFENGFNQDGTHRLRHLSQRSMPKRTCALAVTEDGSTIIAADKFGDVYFLPLLVTEKGGFNPSIVPEIVTPPPETNSQKAFVPAANDLTVHSQRNRKALENQKRQINKQSEKSEPRFEHKLLLGHVSMLTDIALVTHQERQYIITADRDEHIRVSRGIHQAHIIETFCLGHAEFVSKLCIPAERSNLLISGGGDDDLFLWNWVSGLLLSRVNLKRHIDTVLSRLAGETWSNKQAVHKRVAVSGISHVRLNKDGVAEDIIIVSSEGIPALFTFLLTGDNALQHIQTVTLPGNALSHIIHDSRTSAMELKRFLIVSVDSIHKPGSTTAARDDATKETSPLYMYEFQDQLLKSIITFHSSDEGEGLRMEETSGNFTNLLYNLEALRKKDGDTRGDD